MAKKYEIVKVKISDLKDNVGNPRKISRKRLRELQDSLEEYGDMSIITVDEDNNILSGHQRVEAFRRMKGGEDIEVDVKRFLDLNEADKRYVNMTSNTHAGDWDMQKLAEWTAQMTKKVNIDIPKMNDVRERRIKDMEPLRYEKYNYVMIVCRNEIDYLNLTRALGIDDKKVLLCQTAKGGRKIKARAVWYDQMKAQIVEKKQ